MRDFQKTIEVVQTNCHIADARHAREMSMCNYLLGMRELYIWENEFPPSYPLVQADLSQWLVQREMFWETMEELDYSPIPIANREYDPFDNAAINKALAPHGLVYGGGLGRWGKPHFFLAQLLRSEQIHGLTLRVSGCEYARDITAFPAALRENTMFLRTDALQRWLAEKIEIWSVHEADGALKSAIDCYGMQGDKTTLLPRMAEQESEVLILHEIGEAMAEPILGPAWRDMLLSFSSRRAIFMARSVRDHLADCLSTLPELIKREQTCSIHFYFANLESLRRSLFPQLVMAYEHWRKSGDTSLLLAAAEAGRTHWQAVAMQLLDAWHNDPQGAQAAIDGWVDQPRPLAL
ncbi:MAG TPA: hypothetical protein VMV48_06950 [Gallionellaceae bacterium]|nr:hypothetical protein [Gallionellaceae bacterium]